jgi:von Willebrand factor type A domain
MRTLSRVRSATAATALLGLAMLSSGPVALAAPAAGPTCGTLPLDVELILDRSGSMTSNSNAGHTRLYWAQQAADQLVNDLESHGVVGAAGLHHIGITSFAGTTATVNLALGGSNAAAAHTAIDSNTAGGNTPFKAGLAAGGADMDAGARNAVGGDVTRVFILLSDGRPNPDPAQRPSASEIAAYLAKADTAYSIAIGSGGSGSSAVDLALMQQLDKPDGHYYNVIDSSLLPSLFTDIFNEIACQPGIHVAKAADATDLPVGGGTVNYTYTVTNTGNVAMAVDISDDKCSPISGPSGDTNSNSMLDLSETWTYTCSTDVTADTMNTVTATGHVDGYDDVMSQDTWNVTVALPTEPPATEPPATEPPATEPPATEPPATEPPATEPPATEPPAVTEPPVTAAPTQEVAAETDVPTVTLPPTDAIASDGVSADSIGFVATLLLLIVLGISTLVLGPLAARRK